LPVCSGDADSLDDYKGIFKVLQTISLIYPFSEFSQPNKPFTYITIKVIYYFCDNPKH